MCDSAAAVRTELVDEVLETRPSISTSCSLSSSTLCSTHSSIGLGRASGSTQKLKRSRSVCTSLYHRYHIEISTSTLVPLPSSSSSASQLDLCETLVRLSGHVHDTQPEHAIHAWYTPCGLVALALLALACRPRDMYQAVVLSSRRRPLCVGIDSSAPESRMLLICSCISSASASAHDLFPRRLNSARRH